jgi:hypothetical protein
MDLPTNAERAERARAYLSDYIRKYGGGDTDDAATDVITDILHLVNLEGRDPARVWESAYYSHYISEVDEEEARDAGAD